jgi:hypothetical protein
VGLLLFVLSAPLHHRHLCHCLYLILILISYNKKFFIKKYSIVLRKEIKKRKETNPNFQEFATNQLTNKRKRSFNPKKVVNNE